MAEVIALRRPVSFGMGKPALDRIDRRMSNDCGVEMYALPLQHRLREAQTSFDRRPRAALHAHNGNETTTPCAAECNTSGASMSGGSHQ